MNIYLTLIATFCCALFFSLYVVPVVVGIVKKLNLMDHPNERSSAVNSVPTLGGIAIFISFVVATTFGLIDYDLPEMKYILPVLLLIFFVGLTDDIVNLAPYKKIVGQIIGIVILIFLAKIRFTNLHGIFGISEIGLLPGAIITGFTFLVIINAFNLMDGIDGLASGITMLISLVFGGWFYLSGHFNYAILSIALVGSVGGFFYFNVFGVKNKIFMGDTGSLVIGTIISILVIRFNEFNIDHSLPSTIHAAPAISLGILSYPLMDMVRVIFIRLNHARHPFRADKNHFHHRLLILGLSHRQAAFSIIGFNIVFIFAVFYLNQRGIVTIISYVVILCIILVLFPAYFIRKNKLIKKDDPVQQLLLPKAEKRGRKIRR